MYKLLYLFLLIPLEILLSLVIHYVVGSEEFISQLIYTLCVIVAFVLLIYLTYHILVTILNDNSNDDYIITFGLLISLTILNFIVIASIFTLFWVWNENENWTSIGDWDSDNIFIVYQRFFFTSVLANGVGFGSYVPISASSQLIYVFSSGYLYFYSVIFLGISVNFAYNVRNKTKQNSKKKKRKKDSCSDSYMDLDDVKFYTQNKKV